MTFNESTPPPNIPPPAAKTPPMVVWALVLSILGFCGITAIIGIVLGFIGRGRAKEVGKGVGQATAAIVIGSAWLVIGLIGLAVGAGSTDTTSTDQVVEQAVEEAPQETDSRKTSESEPTEAETSPDFESPTEEASTAEPEPSPTEETPEPVVEETETETLAQSNAVSMAMNYLDFSAFSKQGLIEQLEYEGFSSADAEYAVNNIAVNWREQAARKAQEYLDYSAFSRSGLIDQLEFEGFTRNQATYGADAVGL